MNMPTRHNVFQKNTNPLFSESPTRNPTITFIAPVVEGEPENKSAPVGYLFLATHYDRFGSIALEFRALVPAGENGFETPKPIQTQSWLDYLKANGHPCASTALSSLKGCFHTNVHPNVTCPTQNASMLEAVRVHAQWDSQHGPNAHKYHEAHRYGALAPAP